MTEFKTWSQVAATNAQGSPDGWPEGMARSGVNDSGREMMASLRRYLDDPQWLNLYSEDGADYVVSKSTDAIVKLTPTSGVDSTASRYPVGSRIRTQDGSTTPEGFVTLTSYSNPDTFITVVYDDPTDVVQAGVNSIEIACVKDILQATAYSPIGVTLAQTPVEIPSIDLLGDGATLDQGAGNGFDADTVDGQHAQQIIDAAGVGRQSVGFNTSFQIFQRGTTIDNATANQVVHVNDNGLYCADRWLLLSGIGGTPVDDVVDITRETADVPVGFWSAIKLQGATVSGGAGNAERAGIFQIIEKRDCAHLIDNAAVSLSFWGQVNSVSAITGLRAFVLGWTGTEDTLSTSNDPISNWGAEGTVPTFKTSWNVLLDTGRLTGFSNTWLEHQKEGVDFSLVPNVNNIGILLYIDDSEWSLSDFAKFTGVQLENGATSNPYRHTEYTKDLSYCKRYFQKTHDDSQQPAANQGVAGSITATATNSSEVALSWDFATEMRVAPTINQYNPSADATTARNVTDGTNAALGGTQNLGTRGVSVVDNLGGTDKNDAMAIHFDADSEM